MRCIKKTKNDKMNNTIKNRQSFKKLNNNNNNNKKQKKIVAKHLLEGEHATKESKKPRIRKRTQTWKLKTKKGNSSKRKVKSK